jgi:N-acetylglucosaminyldiphosphoundecaprenol N-acetyl-beta-D-mannosaminyltransferase
MTVTQPAAGEARIELMGVEIDRVDEATAIAIALEGLDAEVGGWICTANLDVLRQCFESAEVRELVQTADIVVADGMPVIWASHLAGRPLPERVAGSSLVESLPRAAVGVGASIFLLGGNPGAAEGAAQRLTQANPGLRIAGSFCPPFGFERDPEALQAIDRELRRTRPDIVFVGLPFPKQERLIARLRPVLPRAWFVSCGVSFSFLSGEVSRAPRWVQRIGMEWLHRLFQEPRRLFRRYIVLGLPFLARVVSHAVVSRYRR